MKEGILILLSCFVLGSYMTAQDVLVSDDVVFRTDFGYEILPFDNDEVLLFKDEVFEKSIIAFDPQLKKKWEKKLSFEKKRIGLIGMITKGDRFHLYYFFRDNADLYIIDRLYSDQGGLMSTDTIIQEKYISGVPGYYFRVSPNKKMALIYTIDRKEVIEGYGVDVDSGRVLWVHDTKDQDLEYSAFREAFITDQGEAFILLEKNNTWKRKKEHAYVLLPFDPKKGSLSLEMKGMLGYDFTAALSRTQDQWVLISSYSERSNSKINGLMNFVVDLRLMEVQLTKDLYFNDDIPFNPNWEKLIDNSGIDNLTVRQGIPRTDGGWVVICESSKEYVRRPSFSSSSTLSRRWVDYYFEDMVVFSFDSKGGLEWYNVLHKKQYSQDDDASFSSFFTFMIPAQIRIIYNDEIRSANTVSEYLLTSRGLKERKSLMSTDYANLKLKFREAVQVSPTSFLVPSMRSNKMALVKVTYSDFWTP